MQHGVGLARALAAETDILLMDEAFSALRPLIRREMQDLLLDLQTRLNKTIVFITHDLNEAMRLGDRVAMLRTGRSCRSARPRDPHRPRQRLRSPVRRRRRPYGVLTAHSVMEQPLAVVNANGGHARPYG